MIEGDRLIHKIRKSSFNVNIFLVLQSQLSQALLFCWTILSNLYKKKISFMIVKAESEFGNTFIHSFIHPSILPFIHSFIHSSIHSSIHSFIHSFIHPSIHSFIHSFIHSLIHSLIHSFIHYFAGASMLKKHPQLQK